MFGFLWALDGAIYCLLCAQKSDGAYASVTTTPY
jgi:hypothetical protein